MKIARKERLLTGIALATIGVIAAVVLWSYSEVRIADRQRVAASDISRELSDLRLVAFEYRIHHTERARAQWNVVSNRLDGIIGRTAFRDPEQAATLASIKARRTESRRLFALITAQNSADGTGAPMSETSRRFEGQLFGQLASYQQENTTDAFRLNRVATQRIDDAQQRVGFVTLAGLALIASVISGASGILRRQVLAPIAQLQQATQQVAEGKWTFALPTHGNDEIGELSRNFDAMTQSLRASFAQVEGNNRALAALNQELEAFSYSVSHDLRGPLRSMDGFSLALLEDYGDMLDEEGKDFLRRIRSASQRMGLLIDDLLRLSQVTRTELHETTLDLSAIAREIADVLDQEQPSRNVEWRIDPGMSVHADLPLTRIALQNLLQNARKFTGKTDNPLIRVGAARRDGREVHFVADNGVGFDMAYADRLFGAFQRMHHAAEFPGTGIGLAIVQRIIHRHGGRIWAEAKEGEGATFFFSMKEPENEPDRQDNPPG